MLILLYLASVSALEYAKIFGDSELLGYYYVALWVGSPPVRQSVILDTGSRLTAFPCINCLSCGSHEDSYFDYKESYTSRLVTCHEWAHCNPCSGNHCEYKQAYVEGSSIAGILVEDMVRLGEDSRTIPVRMIFGCHRRETNLFRTQLADGIMGLSYPLSGLPTIVDELYKERDINTKKFSLCFGMERGYMTVGGYNDTFHHYDIQWVEMKGTKFYEVGLTDLTVNGKALNISSADFGPVIIDSGTTSVFLAHNAYHYFMKEFTDYCSQPLNCGTPPSDIQSNICFDLLPGQTLEDYYSSFPDIHLVFDGESVVWTPERYLIKFLNNSYCISVNDNKLQETLIGGTFMRKMDVIFDRSNQKIGFAPSDCDYAFIDDLPDDVFEKESGSYGQKYTVICIMMGILVFIFGMVLYWMYEKKRQVYMELSQENSRM